MTLRHFLDLIVIRGVMRQELNLRIDTCAVRRNRRKVSIVEILLLLHNRNAGATAIELDMT